MTPYAEQARDQLFGTRASFVAVCPWCKREFSPRMKADGYVQKHCCTQCQSLRSGFLRRQRRENRQRELAQAATRTFMTAFAMAFFQGGN